MAQLERYSSEWYFCIESPFKSSGDGWNALAMQRDGDDATTLESQADTLAEVVEDIVNQVENRIRERRRA